MTVCCANAHLCTSLTCHKQVGSAIKAQVDKVNSGRARDMRIRKFAILPPAKTIKGEVTPTFVLRRSEIERNNTKAMEALFSPDLSSDQAKLIACAAGKGPVLLSSGIDRSVEFQSLSGLDEGVTYWTEDGNDLVRNGRSVVLSGQWTLALSPDPALVDEDELAVVNMLYANGNALRLWRNSDQTGDAVSASSIDDFPVGVTFFTANGTEVTRSSPSMLVVDKVRNIPVELLDVSSDFGTEHVDLADLPAAPGTPGSRRLRDLRKTKVVEKEVLERARIEREREEELERQAQEEKRRVLVDQDELALVNMLYANGAGVELWSDPEHQGASMVTAKSVDDFPLRATRYTVNGTRVDRPSLSELVVDGSRSVPLELSAVPVNDFGSEHVDQSELPPTPGTPGSRRLREIRSAKEREATTQKLDAAALERERQRLKSEQEELERQLARDKLEEEGRRRALVDQDELALVNMLYANGPAVEIWRDADLSGDPLSATSADDFRLLRKCYTANGTSVVRSSPDELRVDETRTIPLELSAVPVNDFGSEFNEETPAQAPSTPGARRLRDIRATKDKEDSERKLALERERQREMRERGERAAMEELRQKEIEDRLRREEEDRARFEAERQRQKEEEEEKRLQQIAAEEAERQRLRLKEEERAAEEVERQRVRQEEERAAAEEAERQRLRQEEEERELAREQEEQQRLRREEEERAAAVEAERQRLRREEEEEHARLQKLAAEEEKKGQRASRRQAVPEEIPRVLVVGPGNLLMVQTLKAFQKMGAAETFQLRAACFNDGQRQTVRESGTSLDDSDLLVSHLRIHLSHKSCIKSLPCSPPPPLPRPRFLPRVIDPPLVDHFRR